MSHSPAPLVGPGRMRASDADRDRVAALLREHFEAGRLQEDELEQRLGCALAARRIGQLRELVSDLPGPPPTAAQRTAGTVHLARRGPWTAVRGPLRALAAGLAIAFIALIVIGAIVGDSDQRGSSSSSPGPPPADKVTRMPAGTTGVDDGMAFRVRRVRTVSSFPLRSDYGGSHGARLRAGAHRELAVVGVAVTNHTGKPAEPFCGSFGAHLYSRRNRGYDLVERVYRLAGNDVICSGGIQDGETADLNLVFQVPQGTRPSRLDLWNSADDRDISGHTRLQTPLPKAR